MSESEIPRIPSISDRGFVRVDAAVYLYCEPVDLEKGNFHASGREFFIPTFVQEEDDFVGLTIDAFREQVLVENPRDKDYYLRLQQMLSAMKRFMDGALLGRKPNMYKKMRVNISASGIAFPSDVAYHTGQILRLSLFFPKAPFGMANLLCEVVRSEKAEIGYDIKAKYTQISDKVRRSILDFIEECEGEASE